MDGFMTKKTVGFTLGCFNILHQGHINLLRNAKGMCDTLIVGVLSDDYIDKNKKNRCFNLQERISILSAIKYCDVVVAEDTLEKLELWEKYKFDYLFVGSDWYGDERYIRWEKELSEIKNADVKVIYLPYTQEISSSLIIEKIAKRKREIDNE